MSGLVYSPGGVGLSSALHVGATALLFSLLLRKYLLFGLVSFLSNEMFLIFKAESLLL